MQAVEKKICITALGCDDERSEIQRPTGRYDERSEIQRPTGRYDERGEASILRSKIRAEQCGTGVVK